MIRSLMQEEDHCRDQSVIAVGILFCFCCTIQSQLADTHRPESNHMYEKHEGLYKPHKYMY
jgi:hypothetical protein